MKCYDVRKQNTQVKHNMVRERVNQIYSQTVNGCRLDYDDVLRMVSESTGYSVVTIKKILKAG